MTGVAYTPEAQLLSIVLSASVSDEEIRRQESQWAIKPLRRSVFAKTGGKCFYCGGGAKAVDHFLPITKGGADDIDNLVPACNSCNNSKRHFTLEQWRDAKRRAAAVKLGVPNFHAAQYAWLEARGFDVLSIENVPHQTFWFEEQGFERPQVDPVEWRPSDAGLQWAHNRIAGMRRDHFDLFCHERDRKPSSVLKALKALGVPDEIFRQLSGHSSDRETFLTSHPNQQIGEGQSA